MADSCVSAYFESSNSEWTYCWDDGTPYPGWADSQVTTGLRLSQGQTARAWKTCQYYLKGMSPTCVWWTEGALSDEEGTTTSGQYYCSYVKANTSDNELDPPPDTPTGYNIAQCDFLGRRNWCDKYEKATPDNPNKWICTAPNPYITGLGNKSQDEEKAIFNPVPRGEIWGYNDADDGTGTGLCDCHGMGRGVAGCALDVADIDADSQTKSDIEEQLNALPIQCNYYKPFQMGFGTIQPQKKIRGDVNVDGTISDQGWANSLKWERNVEYRLPLNYEMYNHRARFQKCQWWNEETAREYMADTKGNIYLAGDPEIFDESTGAVEFCINTDTAVEGFNHRIMVFGTVPWNITGAQFALDGVWAKGAKGGPVCNGCRPDCPGYSGRWLHTTNDKMVPGMPVTANQILELRFWSSEWDTKKQYNDFYEHKPNFDDVRTSSIFTFTKWEKLDPLDVSKSIMLGKKLDLCVPTPINNREFNSKYVQEELVTYQSNAIGTNSSSQYKFPSLVRNPNFPELKPFTVVYPYYNDNVFSPEICVDQGPAGHKKRHNTIYGDSIRTIGNTLISKKVYAINASIVPHNRILELYRGSYEVKSFLKKDTLYVNIKDMIEEAVINYPDYIAETTSDDTFGLFITSGIKLKYNSPNLILICVDYNDGSWEYRWRVVDSAWYGGIVKQNTYTHEYGDLKTGYDNSQPTRINPGASISMAMQVLGKSASSELLSAYSFENTQTSRTYYGWSIIRKTITDQLQDRWGPIGNSNSIFVEIDNININYIFDWEVEYAYLKAKTETNETGDEIKVGGENIPETIELEVYTYGGTPIQNNNALPPNFCLLKPVEDIRYRFLNSVWELYVTYKYKEFINTEPSSADDVVAGAGAAGPYTASPYSINSFNGSANITGITLGPVQLLGYFYDENSRLIATNATKALVNIVSERCRNVDIKYGYYAEAPKMTLTPEGGFCIDISGVQATGETSKIVENPNCGDHEYSIVKWEGPMWFPYNTCRGFDLYDEWTVCNHCQAGYVGPINNGVQRDDDGNLIFVGDTALKRNDFRYCGPYQRQAYGLVRSAIPSPCNCACKFYFADARTSNVIFSGYSRVKAEVDVGEYRANMWALPPFGNEGREIVEKYFSHDYIMHRSLEKFPEYYTDWMPMVMDHSMFYSPDFDCFNTSTPEDEYNFISSSYSFEPFKYTNQLNLFTSSSFGEILTGNRFRFDALFEVHHEGNCSYPLPAYITATGVYKAVHYYFLDARHAWAWQEYWKEIERGLDSNGEPGGHQFKFLELERPKYTWSAYKEEKRLICDEGQWTITYIPPVIDGLGNLSKNPKLALGDGKPRPFKILYDTYDSSKIVWHDEGGGAIVLGSSDEDNIYEEAMGGNWIHSADILFDEDAVKDEIDANEIVVAIDGLSGQPSYGYFNRGLIVNITKDRLDYLPKNTAEYLYSKVDETNGIFPGLIDGIETTHTELYSGDQLIPGFLVWKNSSVSITTKPDSIDSDVGISIYRLYIKGNFGYVPTNEPSTFNGLIKPVVNVTANFFDGSSGTPRGYTSITSEIVYPENEASASTELIEYIIDLNFALNPQELVGNKRIDNFTIDITGDSNYFISLKELKLTTAVLLTTTTEELSEEVSVEEIIYVWERRYRASEIYDINNEQIDYNLDGPGQFLKYDLNLKNAGQYFPFKGSDFEMLELNSLDAHSKMRMVSCGIRYPNDVAIDITYDNLHEIEKTKQEYYYNYAAEKDTVGDELNFDGFIPPKTEEALALNGAQYINLGGLYIYSEKLPFVSTTKYKEFNQYDYWRPGGHSYEWLQYWRKEKCMIFDTRHLIFEGNYRHHLHPYPEGLAELGVDILNSYYNLRPRVLIAKYVRSEILGSGQVPYDLLTSANPYNNL